MHHPIKECSIISIYPHKSMFGRIIFEASIKQNGSEAPGVDNIEVFKNTSILQELILNKKIISGHDVSSGGLITCLLEMCFPSEK